MATRSRERGGRVPPWPRGRRLDAQPGRHDAVREPEQAVHGLVSEPLLSTSANVNLEKAMSPMTTGMTRPASKTQDHTITVLKIGEAPQHFKSPAIGEVSRLPMSDLMALWRLDALPASDREAAAARKKLRHPEVFDRLLQRARIAQAIADARAAGLYELAEDAATMTIDSEGQEAE